MSTRNLSLGVRSGVVLLVLAAPTPASAQNCGASVAWFSSPAFPTEVAGGLSADNCAFHQFAWQSFLAAIQPAAASPGELVFESWMPDYGVFVPAGTAVTPWGTQPPAPCSGGVGSGRALTNTQFLRARVAKSNLDTFDPNSTLQATGDPLYDQSNDIVYYAIWMNETEYDYVTSCNFNDDGCISAAPATSAFPPGTIEVKTAWRAFSGTPPSDMYSIQGVIGPNCTPTTLGLVGFHLVVNTPLHPEFLWATFEHDDNAPDCTNPQPEPADGWSFNNPACVQNGQPCTPNQTNVIPTQVCRVSPDGGGSATNVTNIQSLNQSVSATLQKLIAIDPGRYGSMAVWLNYSLAGNLWTVNGQLPPAPSVQAGSLFNANTTMETFFQQAGHNCFTCHGTQGEFAGNAPANLSHLFGFVQRSGGCNNGKGPLPAACVPTPAAVKASAVVPVPAHAPADATTATAATEVSRR